jgi:hypothetical protein
MAFSSKNFLMCKIVLQHADAIFVFMVIFKRPVIITSKCRALGEEAIATYISGEFAGSLHFFGPKNLNGH